MLKVDPFLSTRDAYGQRERERENTLIYFLEENTTIGCVAVSPQLVFVVGERARKVVECERKSVF